MPDQVLRDPRERVSPRARWMWTLSALVQALVAGGLLLAARVGWDWPWPTLVAVIVLLLTYVVVMPQWRYRVHRWEATQTAVYTQTGWWTLERRIAPMSRIQTVDYVEGAIARLFGLASVTVTTASAAGALVIEGLDKTRARELTDELTTRADTVPGDAT
jgi:membrane protein YdbS with pleckstrin-like domain